MIAAILVLGPRAVYATRAREVCPGCKYDLEGLPSHGTCPECGVWYAAKVVQRVGWKFRWAIVPRILVAMLLPAAGPFLTVAQLAWAMRAHYGWTWSAAWYQSAERDLSQAVVFTFPFLVNSWVLVGLPRGGKVADGMRMRGVDAPGFWRSLLMSSLGGVVAMPALGGAAWVDRMYMDGLVLYIAAMLLVAGAMVAGHWVARMLGPFWREGGMEAEGGLARARRNEAPGRRTGS